ncbi:glycoside hydrolase family 88/105 protein [Bifidobacterium vespertilionis]|uniref:Glycoside hydrolase 105 family protein n=1 Tax=Bifidobacterium vespertilionis TaxID=2562524 RepID=A0A5J5DX19_9BIFI|nr:glycoside hydrolase family 88 protein [Bifidobacterium vespertilionis]KAA8821426.1 glycoside hydrolase 105 family protein [Bifidobacterium vespertilionis]KAA8824371.1 glycoside hydrolase 105 family protein [Bifidobacterium vespertilionis]
MSRLSVNAQPVDYAVASVETMMRAFAAADLPPRNHFHYHQGVFLSGVYQTYLLTGDERYFDYVRNWVNAVVAPDGSIPSAEPSQLDDMQPGILLYPLYERTRDERYRRALDRIAHTLRDFPRNSDGGLWHKANSCPHQLWLDGLYMGGPVAAQYGAEFGHPEYFDQVARHTLTMRAHTEDPMTGLYRHAYDESRRARWADPETGLAPCVWGRSVGWVPVAVLDDLDFIPADHPSRPALEAMVRDLLTAVLKVQGPDGRWWQVLDRPGDEGNWPETSCTCLFVAALCKAVRVGILDESALEPAKRGYEAVIANLGHETRPDGTKDLIVDGVCIGTGVGDYDFYCARPTSTNDLHGMGAFLIMTAEVQRVWGKM